MKKDRTEEIKLKLINCIVKEFKISKDKTIELETELINDLGFGSIQIIETAVLLEEAFGVKLDTSNLRLESFKTIASLVDLIAQNGPDAENIGEKVYLEETTLRDGEQTPSVNYFIEEKIDIASMLSEILSEDDTIDAGFPATSQNDFNSVKAISKVIFKNYIMVISRMRESDIDIANEALKDAKKKKIGLIIPTSPIHRKLKLNKEPQEIIEMAVKHIKYAKKYFEEVEVGYEDGSRTELEFLLKISEEIIKAGACSITIADTLGCATPWEFGDIFTQMRNRVPNIDKLSFLGAHCHNDMGLALANSLEALKMGANKIGCAFNGLGERAGNASTEELLMAFYLKPEHIKNVNRDKYQYSKIMECSKLIERYSGIQVQKTKAIVGDNCYIHESGIHQDGILKDKDTYQLFNPSIAGYKGDIFTFGKHSGRNGLLYKLQKLGIDAQEIDIDYFYEEFKAYCDNNKRITDEDIISLTKDVLKRDVLKSIG